MGSVDSSDLLDLQRQFLELEKELTAFYERAAKELATRLLAKVIPRTPVGQYTDGKLGGTLRRGWTATTHDAAATGEQADAVAYAHSLEVVKRGDAYEITVENPVNYASYVEYGHRKRGGKGWVEGRFMLTLSENEILAMQPQILERMLKAMIEEASRE